MPYTKLFSSIITSSIWLEPDHTRIVWITMLALADKNGEVQASVPGLARMAGVTLEACQQALQCLLAPDPHSRTKIEDGRRISPIDGGWELINFSKYRKMASTADSMEANALRQRRFRERHKKNGVALRNESNGERNAPVTVDTLKAEAEAEEESGPSGHSLPPTAAKPPALEARTALPKPMKIPANLPKLPGHR